MMPEIGKLAATTLSITFSFVNFRRLETLHLCMFEIRTHRTAKEALIYANCDPHFEGGIYVS